MPRKTQTARSLHKQTRCPFRFTICFDHVGYYLLAGYGCAKHENHQKVSENAIAILTRLINKSERCILATVATANATNAVGRNIHYVRSGNVIPRAQVRWLSGFHIREQGNEGDQPKENESTVDRLLVSFKEKGYDHCVLYHLVENDDTQKKEEIINETFSIDLLSGVVAGVGAGVGSAFGSGVGAGLGSGV